ncbi:flagellar basal body P-ring formation chaperone FlgA [Thermosulfurimonas sp. F29]|uniref:flagellar basal body P-ring formation chaperone FlgA n=1 Tax=Thermosulfurimonas sp. F29 TaxID=2867247 RepID=UPI001C837AD8|nr:flagellar basal body P-ring formation chaperone FlgA [Thermosulfurimonas sp. F29]MBX6422756.1 flagellar basal body P-ring formation chaperone FlgA [Thermosulfurimonas sp. F29]
MREKTLELLKVLAFLGFLGAWTFLVLVWTGSFVRAETLDEDHFRALFRRVVVEALPWPAEDVEVVRLSAEPTPLEVPDGAVEKVHPVSPPRPGSNTLLVDYLVGGRLVARVRVLGYVEVRVPVVVLKRPVARGTVLGAGDLAVEKRPLTGLPQDVLSDPREAVGKMARYGIPAGRPLRASQLEVPPVIRRNQIVKIVARGRFLTVTAKGLARQDGRPGEIIRVRNLSSKREIYARVVDSQTVEVSF